MNKKTKSKMIRPARHLHVKKAIWERDPELSMLSHLPLICKVNTAYMSSSNNFKGNYDFKRKCSSTHISNHHWIIPILNRTQIVWMILIMKIKTKMNIVIIELLNIQDHLYSLLIKAMTLLQNMRKKVALTSRK